MAWIILATLLLIGIQGSQCVQMAVEIDMAGYLGSVTLDRNGEDLEADLAFVQGLNSNQYDTVELWSLPAVFGREHSAIDVCKSKIGNKMKTYNISEAIIATPESEYFHRSLLVYSSTNSTLPKLCGTILPTSGSVTSQRAKFIGPVFGTVWLRSFTGVGTFVYGDLVTVSTNETELRDLAAFPTGTVDDSGAFVQRCNRLSGTKEVVDAGVSVKNSTLSDGTFGYFSPSFYDARTNLAILNDDAIVACANLRDVQPKTVNARINWEGVKGYFRFQQNSPFEKTVTNIMLAGLASRAKGFHVHKYPVPQRLSASENPCSPQFVSGHFNPYNVDVNQSPDAGTGTIDEYEIGDLSGKYGTLAAENDSTSSHDDWNLPLFGVNSIVGRSIVIHNNDGSRLMCATIGYPRDVTTGITVFKYPIYGTMYFRQDSSNPDEDTTIFLELASQNKAQTSSHNWHVHVYPVNDDAFSSSGTCASAGSHYNPSGVSLDAPYSTECRAQDPLRCELGDLSARLSRINVASTQRTENGKYFFTDDFLPLSGSHSILGRSIVVHGANAAAARYACANITQLRPTVARTTGSWVGTSDGSANGTVTMTQGTEFDTTVVTGSFSNLANLASAYHIHETTISTSAASGSQCSGGSVGAPFNPFGWTASTAATVGTYDQYGVGDLGNKYGLLDGQTTHSIPNDIFDTNLPLHTRLSASDKSIVIHKKDQGASWKCANFVTQAGSNGYAVSATVTFSTTVSGTIKLRQIVYEDGGAGLTSYEVNVSPKSGNANSQQHNWHIHIDPINDQTSCGDALGHFDPYSAADNTDYAADCSPMNPLFCEVGDLSKKQAKYDIGGGRKVFHDVDSPLHTNFTVLGRSIVFHVANGEAPRYTCANIVPDDYTYTLAFPTTDFNRFVFTKALADALGINRMRVVIIHNIDVPVVTKSDGCSRVMVHIAGGGSVDANKLNQLTSGTLQGLGSYAATVKCVNSKGADVLGQKSSSSSVVRSSYWAAVLMLLMTFYNQKLM